jgi:hypothetical protein
MTAWGYGGYGGYADYYHGGALGGWDGDAEHDNGGYDGYNDYYGYGGLGSYDMYAGHYGGYDEPGGNGGYGGGYGGGRGYSAGDYGDRLTEANVNRVGRMGRAEWDRLNERWGGGFEEWRYY